MVFFEFSVAVYHHCDFLALPEPAHPVIINFLNVPEPLLCKIYANEFEERDLVGEECILVFYRNSACSTAFFIRDYGSVVPVLIETRELPPVDSSVFAYLPVEHVWVDAADRHPLVIDLTFLVLQEPAGTFGISFCPECIPRYIEYAVLVAEFRIRCWFNCIRIEFSNGTDVPVEEKYMTVKHSCATTGATCAMKPYFLYYFRKGFRRVLKQIIAFMGECGYPEGDWRKGNGDHLLGGLL